MCILKRLLSDILCAYAIRLSVQNLIIHCTAICCSCTNLWTSYCPLSCRHLSLGLMPISGTPPHTICINTDPLHLYHSFYTKRYFYLLIKNRTAREHIPIICSYVSIKGKHTHTHPHYFYGRISMLRAHNDRYNISVGLKSTDGNV